MSKRGLIFKSISGKKPRTNVFDLSHEKKLSMDFAKLTPIYLQECIPGDKFKVNTELHIKFAPMIAPVMHRINAYVHYFFVPNRLVWDNWQNFITGGVDGDDNHQVPTIPIEQATSANFVVGELADYFGIPPAPNGSVGSNRYINALPFRAYQTIYNEFYRDQSLTPAVLVEKTDVLSFQEITSICTLRSRQWEKDRFTSALTETQRGADVNIPMDLSYRDNAQILNPDGTPYEPVTRDVLGAESNFGRLQAEAGGLKGIDNIESLGATINDLRTSIVLQQWLEKNARAGARYVEQILAHFGRRVPDYTLQRPQYLGGGKQTIQISEVLANFENADVAQGKMAGYGVSIGNGAGFKHTCDEHGYIIGILSILPRTCYYQGIPRMFFKENKFDFAFPEFAHLGEEPVYTNEIYDDYATLSNKTLFGYQSRFSDYKFIQDSVHGDFRGNLDFWHLGRKFAAPPLLNNSFTEANPSNRIFAIQDESAQKIWCQLYNNVRAIRPLPVFGTPIL